MTQDQSLTSMTAEQFSLVFGFLFLVATVAISFSRSMKKVEEKYGRSYTNIMYGIWVEVLVTLIPFIVYTCVGLFRNDIGHVLQTPELAVAAAVLSGQGIIKLLHHVVGVEAVRVNRDRIVFLAALGLLFFLVSVSFIVLVTLAESKPWFTAVSQLILVSFSLPLYSALAGGSALLHERAGTPNEG